MKRILIALALVAGLTFAVAAPAHAEVCEYSVPEMPNDCLTLAGYTYVRNLQADRQAMFNQRNYLAEQLTIAQERAGKFEAEKFALAVQVHDLTAVAAEATALAQARLLKVTALRAKVKELRHILRDVVG